MAITRWVTRNAKPFLDSSDVPCVVIWGEGAKPSLDKNGHYNQLDVDHMTVMRLEEFKKIMGRSLKKGQILEVEITIIKAK